MNLKKEQRKPKRNKHIAIADQVIYDMLIRKELGISRYGTPLQPLNGRNALRDAYEEALDFCMYLKQELIERKIKNARENRRKAANRNRRTTKKNPSNRRRT